MARFSCAARRRHALSQTLARKYDVGTDALDLEGFFIRGIPPVRVKLFIDWQRPNPRLSIRQAAYPS